MKISDTGAWQCETKEPHGFDEPLAAAILKLMMGMGLDCVKDFGCGSGAYVDYWSDRGMWAVGYDGNPNTPYFSPHCCVAELGCPMDVGPSQCVVSLEVGEHIPEQFERSFIENLVLHAKNLLVVSWFPRKGEGIGHVNERSNEHVKEKICAAGFEFMPEETEELRKASTLWWFRESLLTFSRK
jgi:hypothetical protein